MIGREVVRAQAAGPVRKARIVVEEVRLLGRREGDLRMRRDELRERRRPALLRSADHEIHLHRIPLGH